MIRVTFDGGERLAATLKGLSSRMSREVMREALYNGGEVIRARASQNAPREPGSPDLADHIVMSNARPDDGSVGVAIGPEGPDFFYGLFQEEGTTRHGAQPFMRPALDSEGRRAIGFIGQEMWAALVSRGFGSARSGGGGGGLL